VRVTLAKKDIARWRYGNVFVEVERDKSVVEIQDVRMFLEKPVTENKGLWSIRRSDYYTALLPILSTSASTNSNPRLVRHILLDPGHGGKEPGTANKALKLTEKTLTLDVSRRLREILESKHKIRVTLTRSDDKTLGLADRSALTKKFNTDLFLSIHFNALEGSTAVGVETYILTPTGQSSTNDGRGVASKKSLAAREIGHAANTWNVLFGYHLQSNLKTKLKADDRGIRRARFGVLKGTTCPAALVECGFLSNATEAQKIGDPKYRQKIAEALADAIVGYAAAMKRVREQLNIPGSGTGTCSASEKPAPKTRRTAAPASEGGGESGSHFRF
jgi:N-acetylmuramoyl-L-alanine amidase